LVFLNFSGFGTPHHRNMKDIIEQLIGEGQTADALNELVKYSSDGILLLARYNSGKKQYNMGIIGFDEWLRIQSGVNASAMDLAETIDRKQQAPVAASFAESQVVNGPKVFISYNHEDKVQVSAIRQYLEKHGIDVTDESDLEPGGSIELFIRESLKKVDFVVSMVSRNSLQSSWVGVESTMSIVLQKTTEKKFILVSLDDAVFNAGFYFESIDAIDTKVKEARSNITKALDRGISPRPFQDELNRFEDAKNNLGQIIEQLKKVLIIDISGAGFEDGMNRVVKRLIGD
jgi:hypothetical protein